MQNVYSPGLAWAAPTMLGLPMVIVIMVFGGDVGEDGADIMIFADNPF